MDFIRNFVDGWYDRNRDKLFEKTKEDPKIAHEQFVKRAKIIDALGLSGLLLNCSENKLNPGLEISNAAGFSKNGDIPPTFLRYLGFDRVVVGTVTGDYCAGNERPSIRRYVETESLVNWEGLPGIGARKVAENIYSFGCCDMPVTVNFMSTPGKKGDELLRDLENTLSHVKKIPWVDRYELNISCPNTHGSGGELDAREEYQKDLGDMMDVSFANMPLRAGFWLKISSDLGYQDVRDTLDVVTGEKRVTGLVVGNTTTEHDASYVNPSPGKGGASGEAVYEKSKKVQEIFCEELDKRGSGMKVIAVGGINSSERARTRTAGGRVIGVQIYTPLIFRGPRLLRELRNA